MSWRKSRSDPSFTKLVSDIVSGANFSSVTVMMSKILRSVEEEPRSLFGLGPNASAAAIVQVPTMSFAGWETALME
jgi:hypothetical protein